MAHSRKKRRMDTGHFDLVVVGCGGGHDETNLSGYLFKPKDKPWSAGILGLEAGSGYGALKRLMSTTHPRLFSSLFSSQSMSAMDKAHTVYSHLTGYLLTHAHLDHAASLIISSGSLPGPTKYILGARGVLEDLHQCIWQPGRCWPGIVDWDKSSTANTSGGILRALPVAPAVPTEPSGDRDDEYTPVGLGMDDVLVRIVPVSHGCSSSSPQSDHTQSTDHTDHHTQSAGHTHSDINSPDVYKSSAFFIRHAQSRHEFLFFGDVEADPLSPSTRPLLRPIWQHAAHLFTSQRLHALLIECSYPAGRAEAQMFGHLSVEGLRREMRALAQEVVRIREKDGRVLKEVVPQSSEALKQAVPQSNEAPRRSRRSKLVHSALFRVGKGAKRKASSDPSPDSSQSTTIQSSDPLHGALTGLRVIVIHCKDPAPGFDLAGAPTIADFIARQLKYGVQGNPELGPDDLGIEYVAAHQGDEYGTSFPVLDE